MIVEYSTTNNNMQYIFPLRSLMLFKCKKEVSR